MINSEQVPEVIRIRISSLQDQLRDARLKKDECISRFRKAKRNCKNETEQLERDRIVAEKDAISALYESIKQELETVVGQCKKEDYMLSKSVGNPNHLRKPAIRSQAYGHGADISLNADE